MVETSYFIIIKETIEETCPLPQIRFYSIALSSVAMRRRKQFYVFLFLKLVAFQ